MQNRQIIHQFDNFDLQKIMNRNWLDLRYLKHGDARQKEVRRAVEDRRIFGLMAALSPLLAGTFPAHPC
jgi:hypothetical protein